MPLGVGNLDWKNAINSLKSIVYDETITLTPETQIQLMSNE